MVLEDDLVTEHTQSDQASVSFIQLVFRARLVKRAVRKLSESVLRGNQRIYATPHLVEILRTAPEQRDGEQLDELLHAFHHLPFFQTLSELQQAVCCRSIGIVEHNLNDVVYASGDPGTTFYIVLAGECRIEADSGRAALQVGVGDSFGHTELLGGGGEHRRKTTVTASSGTLLATLARADYLRLTGKLENEVIKILGVPAEQRSDTEVVLVRELFKDTPFFRSLHYKMLQDVCCRNMTVRTAKGGEDLFHAGGNGSEYFITIEGTVRVVLQGEDERGKAAGYVHDTSKDSLLTAGSSFGEIAITSSNPKDWTRSAGIHCVKDCTFAVLGREQYLQSTSAIEGRVYEALETPTQQRSNVQIELLATYFDSQPFFKRLGLEGVRRQACSMMFRQSVEAGTVVWEEGSQDVQTFHILLRGGPVREVKDGETVRKLSMGDEFGADGVVDGTSCRSSAVIVDDDCVLATFMRDDYLSILAVHTVMEWVHKFWDLVALEAFGHKHEDNKHDRIGFGAYRELHQRISKTIHDKSYFNAKRETQDAEADWKEDIERAHHGLGGLPDVTLDSLSKPEFCDALFRLVDVWCEHVDAMDLFVEFLKTVFGSISYFDREQKCFRYKKMGQIKSLHELLEDMRSMTLAQFKVDEEARDERRKEVHAERGVQRNLPTKQFGKIVRSSVLIGMLGNSKGMVESTTFETDGTGVASGDMADAKMAKGCPGEPEPSESTEPGKRWLYNSMQDWENIGVVNGGSVMVRVPTASTGSGLPGEDETWVHGTVIRCAADRIIVTHSAGKTVTLYSNNPDTYSKVNGYVVEYAPVGVTKEWRQHSPHVSNLIISAVDTGAVAKFDWKAPVDGHSVHPSNPANFEVTTKGQMPPPGKLADWVGLQQVSDPEKASDPPGRSMQLRLVRVRPDDQTKPNNRGQRAEAPELNTEEPWKDFAATAMSTVSQFSDTQWDETESHGGPQDAETRDLYALLGEMQLRLAQDHRVPELLADSESMLAPTPASQSHSKYAHITGNVGPPREYNLVEVKADIKRLVQRGAAFRRCGMQKEQTKLLAQLSAHRDLLLNLWVFVDNGGHRHSATASQEPKRWYVGSGPRKQRPVTGITERLGTKRLTAKSFSALIPTAQDMVLTPDGPSVVGTPNSYGYSMSTVQRSGREARARARPILTPASSRSGSRLAGRLPDISQGSIGGAEAATGGAFHFEREATMGQEGSRLSVSYVPGSSSRRPMQLERNEFLPRLDARDRSLARSRKSPYRMRPKRGIASIGTSSAASKKYAVGPLR